MEQELELLKQRAEWASSELKAKTTEFASFRTEKSGQILKLQADLDQSRMEATSAKQSNAFHERRVQELQTKLDESNKLAKDLEEKKLIQEEQFRTEVETQRRLGELWEREAKDTKGRIADLEGIHNASVILMLQGVQCLILHRVVTHWHALNK